VDGAVYSEGGSARVRVFEVCLELSDVSVNQPKIEDDSIGLAHGTANRLLGFDNDGNPAGGKEVPSDSRGANSSEYQ